MAGPGVRDSSRDQLLPRSGNPSDESASEHPNSPFNDLFQTLKFGSIIFPGCKAFEQATFIGNLLYEGVTCRAVVQAVCKEDVVATIRFAKKHKFKLSLKSGGHSAGGYCLNDGGIVLDISSMNNVEIDDKDVATVEGGAVWNDVYQCAKKKDIQLLAIGGNCPSVGVSAFLMGGGASPYSRQHGLGIDNLLAMTIVTADGEIVQVKDGEDDQRKKDLFWAIRGGGGGNFGVTVEVKVQLKKTEDSLGMIVAGNLTWKLDKDRGEERFKSMMKVWNETSWSEKLRGDALWHYDDGDLLLGKMTILFNGNWTECMKTIAPLLEFQPQNELDELHWTEWEAIDGKVDVFQRKYQRHTSFIFAEGSITAEVTNAITALMRNDLILKNKDVDLAILWHHIGCSTTKVSPKDTAFYWRKGIYVFHVRMLWIEDSDSSLKDAINDFFKLVRATLQPFSLQSKAAYVNFIDPSLKNWGELYYGENFPRLCRVKGDWDPSDFFQFPQGIPGKLVSSAKLKVVDDESWARYALPSPESPEKNWTVDDVFASEARRRRSRLGIA